MKQETLEEAAKEYCKSLAFMDALYGAPHRDKMITSQTANGAFKAGAEWQRNSAWHKNTEMPDRGIESEGRGENCVVKLKSDKGGFLLVATANKTNENFYFIDRGGHWIAISNIDSWAYIYDIMPTPFEDILNNNKDVLERLKKGEVK